MIKLNTIILIILLSSLLSGCGQKGALRHAENSSLEIDQAYKKQAAKKPINSSTKSLEESSIEKESDQ
ncbi:MAG: putative small lipoprotein YifL [Enterobacterales bacterium]|jgi:predicted small lipoprotein YifL